MARLTDKGARGLPPPPAPTRRRANPWAFSDTARRRQPTQVDYPPQAAESTQAEDLRRELLEGLVIGSARKREAPKPASTMPPPFGQAPSKSMPQKSLTKPRGQFGFWPLLVIIGLVAFAIRIFLKAGESGEWRQVLPALFAIAFIAHGVWRARKKREEREKSGQDGS